MADRNNERIKDGNGSKNLDINRTPANLIFAPDEGRVRISESESNQQAQNEATQNEGSSLLNSYQFFCKQLLAIISSLHEQNSQLQKQLNTGGRISLLPSVPLLPGVPHHHQQQPSGIIFPQQLQVPGSCVPQQQRITHQPRPGSSFSSQEVANALALQETNGWLNPNRNGPQGRSNCRRQETPMHPSVAQFYKYLARPNLPPNPSMLSPVNGSALNAQLRLKAPAESSSLQVAPLGHNNPPSLQITHFTEMGSSSNDGTRKKSLEMLRGPDGQLPEKLRHVEPHMLERIIHEIMDKDLNVCWDDIAGLENAKKSIIEMVVWPLMRPDIFKGCLDLGRGLLLFGPSGTGKTMMAKAIAGEMKATFFHVSARTLASKWAGDCEKLARALFRMAHSMQPAVIYYEGIDLILNKRTAYAPEYEYSRRLKTQFLIEIESMDSQSTQVLLIGATRKPQDLDEIALSHLTRRLHMPLPSPEVRTRIISNLLKKDGLFCLSEKDLNIVCGLTEGYSGSDMAILVKTAAMGPLRDAMKEGIKDIKNLEVEKLRAVTLERNKANFLGRNTLYEEKVTIS
ncbi:unnamed protein product [Dovyalis caffra]|uniref:AAA+ ATPase domain-containing protein n=1 Tax=Dovyalis caffra TaxID=77055 RepID=A0AAV1R2T0_9ROSI|nr:unnamed protein product [Dovyalis caffra]